MKEIPELDAGDVNWKGNETKSAPTKKAVKTLRCTCCGTGYQRGEWKCCSPPSGMANHEWIEQWCEKEPGRSQEFRRCPKHCECSEHTDARS